VPSRDFWTFEDGCLLKLISREACASKISSVGNWMGPPLAICVHRDLASIEVRWSDSAWTADMELFAQWAFAGPTAVIPVHMGAFYVSERRFFKEKRDSMEVIAEDYLARIRLLRTYSPEHLARAEKQFFMDIVRHGLPLLDTRDVDELSTCFPKQVVSDIVKYKVKRMARRMIP